jgi:DNA-binding NarL/FixJ family response regulator
MERTQDTVSGKPASHPTFHVLVVDDHPLLRKGLGKLVSSFGGFDIVGEAADRKQGCELAQQLQPDVVLMDIQMPKMNGIDATRWIKAKLPHVIIVGLSIRQDVVTANHMKAAGATAYLTKETAPEELYRVIHSALTTRAGAERENSL